MTPRRSFRGWFTANGRLRNRWAAALAEPDPSRCLRRLRDVWPEFVKKPSVFTSWWVPFLVTVFDQRTVALLTLADFKSLEATGAQLAEKSAGKLALEDAWLPVVAARDTRNEGQAASALLARLFRSPTSTYRLKASIARDLAIRGACGDEQLTIYVDRLSVIGNLDQEPEILAVVVDCLTVGFDVDTIRVKRAGELARRLRAAGIVLPECDLALGFSHLLINRDYARAGAHLKAAWSANRADQTALAGLLSSYLHRGDHSQVVFVARAIERPAPRPVEELIELAATLAWLDDPSAEGPPPTSAAQVASFAITAQAGDWLAYAVGRLHLLEGDAEQAVRILDPLADRHPEQACWGYHAAWALVLLRDWGGVARRFLAAKGWDSRWTVGCLLMDGNPTLADQIGRELRESHANSAYSTLIEARVSLARGARPSDLGSWPRGGTLEEELEALRTVLGHQFAERNHTAVADALTIPAFRHLPLAEQLLWSGLSTRRADTVRSQVAEWEHPRADLVLAIHYMEEGRPGEAKSLLERFSWRVDTTLELLRGWVDACAGKADNAVARFEQLAAQGEPRAHYALGNIYLDRAAAATAAGQRDGAKLLLERAVAEFQSASVDGARSVPADVEVLARCAELVSDATADTAVCAKQWLEVKTWSAFRHRPWICWIVAAAQLAGDPAGVDIGAAESLVSLLDEARPPTEAAANAVAYGLARVCLASREADRANAFADLLGRLARRMRLSEVRRLHGLAVAAAARHRSRPIPLQTGNTALAFVWAEHALDRDDSTSASHCLRAVRAEDELPHRIGRIVADLLDGHPTATPTPIPLTPNAAPQVVLACRIANAAAMAERSPDQCLEEVVSSMQDHDLTGIVDLSRSLPSLCAKAYRTLPQPLVAAVRRLAALDPQEGTDPLTMARCASAVGEHKTASTLWRHVLGGPTDVSAPLRDEYFRFLCHQAVVARQQGRDLDAVDCIRLAASVAQAGSLAPAKQTSQELRELARNLELEVCIGRLLAFLFPGERTSRETSGRHRVLAEAIEGDDQLWRALVDDDHDAVPDAWATCLAANANDVRLHHTLAVLYREKALAKVARDGSSGDLLVFATALWALLLGTNAFWKQFGWPPDKETELQETVALELLSLHAAQCNRELVAGRPEAARLHLRCLANCVSGATTLIDVLDDFELLYLHTVDERFGRVSKIAEEVLNNWCAEVVRVAQKLVDDPEVIATLPEGISKNYEGGIRHLEPYAQLEVPVARILRTGLEWYNDWCYCLYARQDFAAIRKLTALASLFAYQLIPLCVAGRGHVPANQALSRYFLLRGFANDAPSDYGEALKWNPGNDNARQLLSDSLESFMTRRGTSP